MIVSKQNDIEEKIKDIDAYRHGLCWTIRDGKRLLDNKMDAGGTKCQHFSIRGYVARTREMNGNICWPFPHHLFETRSKEENNVVLPPIEVPQYKWWNCRKCLDGSNTSSESLVEQTYMKYFHDSLQACDGNSDPGHLMFGIILPTSNTDLQEKCRGKTLNHTKVVECSTVDLNSKSVLNSSARETEKEKRVESVVTKQTMEHCGKRIVSMDLQEGKSETANATEEKSKMLQCLSKSERKADMTEKDCPQQDRETARADMGLSVMQSVSSILTSKVDDELGSKEIKSDSFQNIHQSSNSWEYFSRNKNIFEQISKKIREKETTQDTSQILSLGSEICDADHPGADANKLENISTAPVSVSCDKNVQPDQQTLAEKNNNEAISKKVIKPSTVQTIESNIKEKDCLFKASDEKNEVPCTNNIGSPGIEDRDRSNLTEGKECGDLPMNQESLDIGSVLLSKETEKLKVSESRSKRKSQKKRSLADIIASDSLVLENCNKETEESKWADIMEENICRAENHEQLPVQEVAMRVPKDAVKTSPKSRVETSNISEIHVDADIITVKRKKRRPENLKMKKKQGKGIQSLDGYSSFFSKDSSNSRKSEVVSNIIQIPQDASNLVQASKDKLLEDSSVHVDGQIRQRFLEMDDDIPMDVVELMAKNQRERGLSELPKNYKSKKDDSRVKIRVNESDVSHANDPIQKEMTGSKCKAAIPKNLAESEKTNQANPQVYLRTHIGINTSGEDSQLRISQMISQGHSSFSDREAIKSDSLKDHSETLQSSQWFNPWVKHPNFIVPVFSGTNVACDPPASIVDGFNSKVAISQEGTFCTNGMSPDFLQVPRAAARDFEHMQMNNLYGKDTNASLECRNLAILNLHNNSEPSLHYTGVSSAIDPNQNLTKTGILCSTSGNSDLDSGPKCNIPFQNHKGKVISVPPGKTDGVPFPSYFVGQSNSALLQQVNAQARPIFGNKHSVSDPSVPVLRLMGQSVSVPVNCGIEQNILPENKNNGTFSELLHASSQNHVTWFHPVTCASSGASCEDRVFKISVPTQDSMCVKQPQSSKIAIPPVPKFSPVCLVSNGHSVASSSFCTVPGKADVVKESSIANKQFPFQGAPLFVMQQKSGLHCTNGYNGNLQTLSTIPPPTSQTTESVKGASPTKGPRSYRRPPTSVHLNRYCTAAANMYSQIRHRHPQSLSISGTNPKRRKAEAAMKAKRLSLIKDNKNSAFPSRRSRNGDICTLNQNPAEIIIDDGENMDGFGHEHFASAPKALSHSKGKGNLRVPNGEKRRRVFKTKYLQEFIGHKNDHTSDLAYTNVGTSLLNN